MSGGRAVEFFHTLFENGKKMELSVPFMLVIISIASLLAQWLAWRLRIPSILPLLLIGVLLGPGVHLLQPDILFGPLLFPTGIAVGGHHSV